MLRRSQLEWVQGNRQPRSRTVPIGAVVDKMLAGKLGKNVRHREAVRACVGRVVDDTFREFCTLGRVDQRSVEIVVKHPSAAAGLRRAWLMCLLEHLEHDCRFAVSPKIQFSVGESEDRFPSPGAVVGACAADDGTVRP